MRKCSRACSLPARPSRFASSGSSRISTVRSAAAAGRVDEEAGDAVVDLQGDPADVAADHRPALPLGLGDGEPEALADRLLHADVGLGLKGVDLDRADVVEVVEDLDVGVAVGVAEGRVEEVPALGVVGGHRADQRQLGVGDALGDHPVGVDHTRSDPSRDRTSTPGRSGAGPCRCRTARRRRPRPRARAPCSWATAGRSPAGRSCAGRRRGRAARTARGARRWRRSP